MTGWCACRGTGRAGTVGTIPPDPGAPEHTMAPSHPTVLKLQPGESRLIRLQAGDQLFAAQGSLQLTEPPETLDEQAWRLRRTLHCGAGHAVTRAGWVRLEAGDAPAQLQLNSAAPAHDRDTLPACDPRAAVSPAARSVWQLVERLAVAVANSARQRQQMPS